MDGPGITTIDARSVSPASDSTWMERTTMATLSLGLRSDASWQISRASADRSARPTTVTYEVCSVLVWASVSQFGFEAIKAGTARIGTTTETEVLY